MTKVAIFGAAPDTLNMGVSALLASQIDGLSKRLPGVEFVVFDNKRGVRRSDIRVSEDRTVPVTLAGAHAGRRYYRPENLAMMKLAAEVGGPLSALHPMLRLLNSCDAVLNISGGDSFSDIYGKARFASVIRPMQIAKALGKPLILPPQTYGPYNAPETRRQASDMVKSAAVCWARDVNSFEILKDLLGESFDPERHKCGVDVAFGLATRDASDALPAQIAAWLADGVPIAGINVNGLIYLDPEKASSHYRFKADYRRAVVELATWLLENSDHKVVLVPHVMQPVGSYESDAEACADVLHALPDRYSDRIAVSPMELDQCQAKWLISKTDWFCGTRMHSTIASLSTGVPTASIVYSDKARGVFSSCKQEAHALDPRDLTTEEILAGLQKSFQTRKAARVSLAQNLPDVKATVEQQMDIIADCIGKAVSLA
jgi:polysaccharide pyruvyl transferase WcaK-like protein